MLIGYQAVYDADFLDAIQWAKGSGFDYVSFDLNVPRFYIDRLDDDELKKIRSSAESVGVGLAFHAPGDNISLFSDYPGIREAIVDHFCRIIAAAEKLGARHVTLHPGVHPSFRPALGEEDGFARDYAGYFSTVLCANLRCLADWTRNVLLCVENFHFTQLTMDVMETMLAQSDKVFLTWDFAKTSGPLVERFMWSHADRIREVHAHDVVTEKGRSHQAIGDGSLDFRKYARLMNRADVATTIEVRPRECAELSRHRLLDLLGA